MINISCQILKGNIWNIRKICETNNQQLSFRKVFQESSSRTRSLSMAVARRAADRKFRQSSTAKTRAAHWLRPLSIAGRLAAKLSSLESRIKIMTPLPLNCLPVKWLPKSFRSPTSSFRGSPVEWKSLVAQWTSATAEPQRLKASTAFRRSSSSMDPWTSNNQRSGSAQNKSHDKLCIGPEGLTSKSSGVARPMAPNNVVLPQPVTCSVPKLSIKVRPSLGTQAMSCSKSNSACAFALETLETLLPAMSFSLLGPFGMTKDQRQRRL